MLRTCTRLVQQLGMGSHVPREPLIVILGATGTGKSQLAVEIAESCNGEVLNADAMQLYDGLAVITNKIPIEEQHGVPHHLLGVIGIHEPPWTVSQYKLEARKIIAEIRSRGRTPVIVGGTHYYTQSLLFEDNLLSNTSANDQDHNTHLEAHKHAQSAYPILDAPTEDIIEQLRAVDPVMADRWHPNDRRKIQRSLEIYLTTGRKASEVYAEQRAKSIATSTADQATQGLAASSLFFWVHAEADILRSRLDDRVEKMIANGLIEEVTQLKTSLESIRAQNIIVDESRGIWVSIGYKEFQPYLTAMQDGVTDTELHNILEQAKEQTQAATRQYSRRQIRWIRIKLMAALEDIDLLDNLYLLDGSDVLSWQENIREPAVKIVTQFLEGKSRPDPRSLSAGAKSVLTRNTAPDLGKHPELWTRHHCDLCKMTAVTDLQWQLHLKSRRHRYATKRRQKDSSENDQDRREDVTSTDTSVLADGVYYDHH